MVKKACKFIHFFDIPTKKKKKPFINKKYYMEFEN